MKVDDIRPDELLQGQQAAMWQDIEFLRSRSYEFVEVNCPACGSDKRQTLYEKYYMTHRLCEDCETQYISPRPTGALLGEFYATSENYKYWAANIYPRSAEMRREKMFRPRAQMVSALQSGSGRSGGLLVEVGAGWGLFCEEVARIGAFDQIVGLEPSPDLAETCRRKGLDIIEKPFEDTKLSNKADVIVLFEVIEHLHDPKRFVRWAFENLIDGGILVLSCPNIKGFDMLLLGSEANAIDHQHLNYFHPASMIRLLQGNGFGEVEVTTPGSLDVDLVRRAWRKGLIDEALLGPVLSPILNADDPETLENFQSVLCRVNLSSHMMAVARK